MKKILGLDLGTNSIGWAMLNMPDEGTPELPHIEAAGSRVIPMDAARLGDFERGNPVSQTADRTRQRGIRRLYERSNLRRERLHRVLRIMGFLPEHYAAALTPYGQFKDHCEPKLPWSTGADGKPLFLFKSSFEEMLADFRERQPELVAGGKRIPYDWTLYYLRRKALTSPVSKEELAWILLSFNRKRGYAQTRAEATADDPEATSPSSRQYFEKQPITQIIDTGQTYKENKVLRVVLANGLTGKLFKKSIPDWVGQEKTIIVTIDLDKQGNPRLEDDGTVRCRFQIPTEEEWGTKWALVKQKTEHDLTELGLHPGVYIYEALLADPSQKIIGKLVRVIDRPHYKNELHAILRKQQEFHPELSDDKLYADCLHELYGRNDAYRDSIASRGFVYLLADDILFYQRPLKSKKSLIANCPLESRSYVDSEGVRHEVPLKCIAKSHPLYQEFRLWQFVSNLRIYQREQYDSLHQRFETDVDATARFLPGEAERAALYAWLADRASITQDGLLGYPAFKLSKAERALYRWNYVEDKEYPAGETRHALLTAFDRAKADRCLLTEALEEALWQILYAINDSGELRRAVTNFVRRHALPDALIEALCKVKPFKDEYGAYSAKAIKKLLPLMREGSYWSADAIDTITQQRIAHLVDGEYDDSIRERVREKSFHLDSTEAFRGLPTWLACYVAYDRHSEARDLALWRTPEAIDAYLDSFRQHSLRNPIVEQVVLETLRVVRDVWRRVGRIDEIHVEIGRDMKQTTEQRRRDSQRIAENEATNQRIRILLHELKNSDMEVADLRPYSPTQQELMRIYEEGAWDSLSQNTSKELDEYRDIKKRLANSAKKPTAGEVRRYALWLEQNYRSPYTGNCIPLSRLFTTDYEIEHVIPRALYFDDSISNKVICESEINKLKGKMLGHEFIKANSGRKVELSHGRTTTLFTLAAYEDFVKRTYASNRRKRDNLLADEVPSGFSNRQLGDMRYISKFIRSLLSNIVREEGEQEMISKNIITCVGSMTDRVKHDWGLDDVWNHLILPRFERMNELTKSNDYTSRTANGHLIPTVPLEQQAGFSKKRIDHRHHAMDAIVIACISRNVVTYLNNESASSSSQATRHDLQRLLCEKVHMDDEGNYTWRLRKPWPTFTEDAGHVLRQIVPSFKQNQRIINKTSNHYLHFDANGKKQLVRQTKGDSWAIRKPMHKETVFGEVNLRQVKSVSLRDAVKMPERIVDRDLKRQIRLLIGAGFDFKQIKTYFDQHQDLWNDINLARIDVYYFTKETNDRYFASRKPIDESFDEKRIKGSITDTGIQAILLRHLQRCGGNPKEAFSPEGLEAMNANIQELNNGKPHQPVYKVRVYEKADKYCVGEQGNKSKKFVEAAKGTNLFFAIYESEVTDKKTGEVSIKRSFDTIPLRDVVSRQKAGLPSAPDRDGVSPKYVLSPNDLVYVPTPQEREVGKIAFPIDKGRIYKMVSATGSECHFIPEIVSGIILNKVEFEALNKLGRAITGEMIKDVCIPIKVDRLGNIIEVDNKPL